MPSENKDWFGESPAEMREVLPSHFEDWKYFCSLCDKESLVKYGNLYLCIDHAEEVMLEWQE